MRCPGGGQRDGCGDKTVFKVVSVLVGVVVGVVVGLLVSVWVASGWWASRGAEHFWE